MSKNTDIVIQGAIWKDGLHTYKMAKKFIQLPFVNKVIISTWENEREELNKLPKNDQIQLIFSDPPEYDGGGNVNFQIVSSRAGIDKAQSDFIVKIRSDQFIFPQSMLMMNNFVCKFSDKPTHVFEDGSGPKSHIFTLGVYDTFPYHVSDHVFWGRKDDMKKLFDIPLSQWESFYTPHARTPDYNNIDLRSEIHIGSHYCAKFNRKVYEHICRGKEFFMDNSPRRQEAMILYDSICNHAFKSFPIIDMHWAKYNCSYKYDLYIPQGMKVHDEEW